MKIQLPQNVNYIINQLIKNGYEAYAVGGCVRDSILGKEPEDWDITTSAKPLEIKKIFPRTVDTGIIHGTVTVLINKVGYEVTTYRIDGEYEDSRHPKSVEFTSELANDLQRRDFTINAMAYNEENGIIDLYHGLEDIQNGVIRCVGNAIHRFEEDALRILRAFRFSAQLNFQIEKDTLQAAFMKKENLNQISAERIRTELNKLLLSEHPEKLVDLYRTEITPIILPEFNYMIETKHEINHVESIGIHAIKAVKSLKKLNENDSMCMNSKIKLILRWALLLHESDISNRGKNSFVIAKNVLKRLKFDNETLDKVVRLVKWSPIQFTLTLADMRKSAHAIGTDLMELLFIVKEADIIATNEFNFKEQMHRLESAKELYKQIIENGDCINLSMLNINGKDLIDIGFKPGIQLGETLNILLDKVLEDPILNNKETLLNMAKPYLK